LRSARTDPLCRVVGGWLPSLSAKPIDQFNYVMLAATLAVALQIERGFILEARWLVPSHQRWRRLGVRKMSEVSRLLTPSHWARKRAPRGTVDAITSRRVAGWAFAPSGEVEIEAWLGSSCVARARPSIERVDVANAYPGQRNAILSGFVLELPEPQEVDGETVTQLQIVAKAKNSILPATRVLCRRDIVPASLARRLAKAPASSISGPFPSNIVGAIAAAWPDLCKDLDSAKGQQAFVDRLLWIMQTPPLNALPAFVDYARYLTATIAHCRFVERHFPATNAGSQEGASDFHSKPNSVDELFAIIHQLYVLKKSGVAGDFAEFGCFKGYSSSMLSFACAQLDIQMHIFDSFAGLPEAKGSGYEAGQFAGSLDEVKDNISRFGTLSAVKLHPGFFADSLRDYSAPELLCLWMDVDLEVSACDLLVVADRLDPRGSLFSHECTADIFNAGRIVTHPRPDNPIYPLVTRHEELGRALTGHHVAGYTGAFWPQNTGTPVADGAALRRLRRYFETVGATG